jgi:hypothetical protein
VYVRFLTSNGWKITVFNDAGCFDYIEAAVHPSGAELDYEDINGSPDKVEGPKRDEFWGILEYFDVDPEFPDQEGGPE